MAASNLSEVVLMVVVVVVAEARFLFIFEVFSRYLSAAFLLLDQMVIGTRLLHSIHSTRLHNNWPSVVVGRCGRPLTTHSFEQQKPHHDATRLRHSQAKSLTSRHPRQCASSSSTSSSLYPVISIRFLFLFLFLHFIIR